MKSGKRFMAMGALAAALVLVLAACDTGSGGGSDSNNSNNSTTEKYTAQYGAIDASYSEVKQGVADYGATPASSGTDWMLFTGTTATTMFTEMQKNVPAEGWLEKDSMEDTFDKIVGMSNNGVSLPSGLKSALNANKAKAPLAALFGVTYNGQSITVAFYITKKN